MPVAFEDFFTQIIEHDTPSQLTVPNFESFWVEGGGSITRRDNHIVHKYRAAEAAPFPAALVRRSNAQPFHCSRLRVSATTPIF